MQSETQLLPLSDNVEQVPVVSTQVPYTSVITSLVDETLRHSRATFPISSQLLHSDDSVEQDEFVAQLSQSVHLYPGQIRVVPFLISLYIVEPFMIFTIGSLSFLIGILYPLS